MQTKKKNGFTLIELLFVVGIIAVMVAVIVPRAMRARVDAKYETLRQNCTELASFANQWAEKALQGQDDDSQATLVNYFATLTGETQTNGADNWNASVWVADNGNPNNWKGDLPVVPSGRTIGGETTPPNFSVEDLASSAKVSLRNPFNGTNVFISATNYPSGVGHPVAGAIACGGHGMASNSVEFALVYQGTDSSSYALGDPDSFYAGQGSNTLEGLRNGVFLTRLKH